MTGVGNKTMGAIKSTGVVRLFQTSKRAVHMASETQISIYGFRPHLDGTHGENGK